MKKLLFLVTIITISSLFFIQCKKDTCHETKLDDKIFTADEINIVPYDHIAEITFKNSIGDSVSFTPQQPHYSTMHNTQDRYTNDEYHCRGNYLSVQDVNYFLSCNSDSNFLIRFQLAFANTFGIISPKIFHIYVYYIIDEELHYHFSGSYFFECDSIMNTSPHNWDCYIFAYHNSLTILNNTYNNVYEFTTPGAEISTIYYSISQGIVGYKEIHGTLWYLSNSTSNKKNSKPF